MRNLAFQPRGPPAGQNLHCPGQQPRQCSRWLDYIRSQEASTVAWSLGWDLEWVIPLYTHDGLADGSPKAPLLSSALSSSQALPSWDIPTCWSSMANLQKCSCCLCRFFFPLFAYNLKIILSIVKYSKKSFDGGMDILMKIKAKEPPRPTSVPMCNVTLG